VIKLNAGTITLAVITPQRDAVVNEDEAGNVWLQADLVLAAWRDMVPDGATQEVKYNVVFEDGFVYKGTYPLERHPRRWSLAAVLLESAAFYAGVSCPVHGDKAKFAALKKMPGMKAERERYEVFLKEYQIGR